MDKKCNKCLETKDGSCFTSHTKSPDGLAYYCKECMRRIGLERYQLKKTVLIAQSKSWNKAHPDKVKQYRKKFEVSIHGRLKKNISKRLRRVLKKLRLNQKGYSCSKVVGCSIAELKMWLESKFREGMNWNNYGGNDYSKEHWHVDHVQPISSFDLTNLQEKDKVNHYTNLQPLWWQDNIAKGNKIFPPNFK